MSPLPATQTLPAWLPETLFLDVEGRLVKNTAMTVVQSGTSVLAEIFDADGTASDNPLPTSPQLTAGKAGGADANGNVQFGAAAGLYDILSGATYVGTVELTARDGDLLHTHGDETKAGQLTLTAIGTEPALIIRPPGGGNDGSVYFQDSGGASKWRLHHFDGTTWLSLTDYANARDHVRFTAGNSAAAAMTEVNSRIQADDAIISAAGSGADALVLANPTGAGSWVSDSAAGDAIFRANTGKVLRLGAGSGPSSLRVTATQVEVVPTLLLDAATPIKLPSGTAGQVLTSDASGNLTLQAPSGGLTATVASREQLQTVDDVALRQFRAALANRFNARCNICVLGDSIWEGQGATSLPVRGVNRLAAQLRNRFPVFGVAGGQGYLPAYFAGATPTLPAPATLVGAPGQASNFGPGFRNFALAGTQTVTFTVVGTSCDVMFAKGSGAGTMGVSIDGGTVTSINTTAGATADGSLQRFTFANQGTHTVAISAVSGTAFIDGLIVYNQDESAGITVHDCSHSGYHLSDFSGAIQTNLAAWLTALGPSLVIVALGVNDYNVQTPLATFAANITTLLNTIKGLTPKPSILFHIDYDPFGVGPITWPQYVAQIYTTVGSDPAVAILDASLRMPGSQTTPNYGLYYTDNVHPSAAGHSLLAENVLAEVSPR